jgi:hypothetical protein
MDEWGIPNWRESAGYGRTDFWQRNRWRWEFLRRREDVRAAFDEQAENTFLRQQKFAGKEGFPTAHLLPNQPGFTAMHVLAPSLGLPGLPNPRIGDQPPGVIAFSGWDGELICFNSQQPPAGFERIDFDMTKPLEPQLALAGRKLKELQVLDYGKTIQKRRHPAKWLAYLRVLDGRASGASWSDLTQIFPMRNGTEQAARDAWQQADALRFNF